MATLKSFSNTKIALSETQAQLESILAKYRINASRWSHFAQLGKEPGEVVFEFEYRKEPEKQPLGFRVSVEYKAETGPKGGSAGTTREQAGRAIYWHVKNLFDAVDFGIVDIEQAFMPYLMLPSGETVYQRAPEFLAQLLDVNMPALLTEGRNR